jgi:hypothetical protein
MQAFLFIMTSAFDTSPVYILVSVHGVSKPAATLHESHASQPTYLAQSGAAALPLRAVQDVLFYIHRCRRPTVDCYACAPTTLPVLSMSPGEPITRRTNGTMHMCMLCTWVYLPQCDSRIKLTLCIQRGAAYNIYTRIP